MTHSNHLHCLTLIIIKSKERMCLKIATRNIRTTVRWPGFQNKFYAKYLISPQTTTLSLRKLKMRMYKAKWENKLRRKINDFATYFNNYMETKQKESTNAIIEAAKEDELKEDSTTNNTNLKQINKMLELTSKQFPNKFLSQKKLGKQVTYTLRLIVFTYIY